MRNSKIPELCFHKQFSTSCLKPIIAWIWQQFKNLSKTSEIKCHIKFWGTKTFNYTFPFKYFFFFFKIKAKFPELWSRIWESKQAYCIEKKKKSTQKTLVATEPESTKPTIFVLLCSWTIHTSEGSESHPSGEENDITLAQRGLRFKMWGFKECFLFAPYLQMYCDKLPPPIPHFMNCFSTKYI